MLINIYIDHSYLDLKNKAFGPTRHYSAALLFLHTSNNQRRKENDERRYSRKFEKIALHVYQFCEIFLIID
jgi:hypothetical protein